MPSQSARARSVQSVRSTRQLSGSCGVSGDMGFDASDPRIKKACEYTFEFQGSHGGFRRNRESARSPIVDPCDTSSYLVGLASVGMGSDPRVEKGFKALAEAQREDGGWVRDRCIEKFGWTRSCPPPTHSQCCSCILLLRT